LKARQTLYRAAQQVIINDRPLIYLYHPVTRAGIATNLSGVKIYPDTLLRVANAQYK
jgi:peptide/nickel transport system substrate-binding protein